MLQSRATLETALNHRSIRKFTEEKIPQSVLDMLIQAGQMASTSSYLQSVSIIRVRDREKRAQIRKICAKAYQGKLGHHYVEDCAEFLVFCVDTQRHLHFAPEAQIDYLEVLLASVMDVGIMAQNVLLTAESLGLGGVFIGSLRNDLQELAEILQTPYAVVPVLGLCLGYPAQESAQRPRLPREAMFFEDVYQAVNVDCLKSYNKTVHHYYKERGLDLDWRRQVRQTLSGDGRSDMWPFIKKQGFAKR